MLLNLFSEKLDALVTRAPWARFDHQWYASRYRVPHPEIVQITNPVELQEFYITIGRQLTHSPNPFFDENYYLLRYPEVSDAIQNGKFLSGWDHYCCAGYPQRAPHWLFDRAFYWRVCAKLGDDALHNDRFANGYHHFLDCGDREQRAPSLFFDPRYYQANLPDGTAGVQDDSGAYRDFLARSTTRMGGIIQTTPYFDPDWYHQRYPAVRDEIEQGLWSSALHHYLANDKPTDFDPLEQFSEAAYRDHYPDVAADIEAGHLRNCYEHFLSQGVFELRSPSPAIDLDYYLSAHPEARRAVISGSARDGFVHFLSVGRPRRLRTLPPPQELPSAIGLDQLFRSRAEALLWAYGKKPPQFTVTGTPDVTVVIVAGKDPMLTRMSLSSLRSSFSGQIELILVFPGVGRWDGAKHLIRYAEGATAFHLETELGSLRGTNAGAAVAAADNILLLDEGVELGPGALANALIRLCSDPTIGAVTGKVIQSNGRLEEAGSIIWQDGTITSYMHESASLAPEVNFLRDVDCCRGAFLLVRGPLLESLVGLDDAYVSRDYGVGDLCVRVQSVGYRVVYDPAVTVQRLTSSTAASSAAASSDLNSDRAKFQKRHAEFLQCRFQKDDTKSHLARCPSFVKQQRILFVEDMLPLRAIGSGFVRSNDLVQTMAELGYHVTVYPINKNTFDLGTVYGDMPDTAEVMHDKSIDDLPDFLERRDGYYDIVWIARTHNLDGLIARLSKDRGLLPPGPRYILDTEALFCLRDRAKVNLSASAEDFDLTQALASEFRNAATCEQIVAVSDAEAVILHELGHKRVAVIGHARAYTPTPYNYQERKGLLFVGAIHRQDSPNYDGLCWFINEVLPIIGRELGYEAQLSVAGYMSNAVAPPPQWLNHPRVTLLGPVTNLKDIYGTSRIFVAPTRYAAGLPYKIHEAVSFGVPVVASAILGKQLGWEPGRDILTADTIEPSEFAQAVVRIYRSEELWQSLRKAAACRLQTENSWERYKKNLAAILADRTLEALPLEISLEACLGGRLSQYIGKGWSHEERWGRWTEGERAFLSFPINSRADCPSSVDFRVFGYVPNRTEPQTVDVIFNGCQVDAWVFLDNSPVNRRILISSQIRDSALVAKALKVEFFVRHPISPLSAGTGRDVRELGLALINVKMNSM